MKARDIIPGWPRPKSTLHIYGIYSYRSLARRIMDERHEYDKVYHQMQQAMVNEWFERYRKGDAVFKKQYERFALPGEVGKCKYVYVDCENIIEVKSFT